jgi:hypothetical protein
VIVLAALAVAAAAVLVTIWPAGTADRQGSGPGPAQGRGPVQQGDAVVPPSLGLEAMEAPRAAPANRRDLFRFGSAAPASAPGGTPGSSRDGGDEGETEPAETAEEPAEPAGPPGPAPIPLRYVGYAETPGTGKVAALSDGRFTYHGREGDVIEGRWRLVTIGVESLVIERVDGSGRQTLRLQ